MSELGARESVPLGEPNSEYMKLPLAWKAALKFCPWCRGNGHWDGDVDDERPCGPCEGSGDLFGTMLKDAYLRGRDHVLARLREVEAVRRHAAGQVVAEEPSREDLRAAMGMTRR